MTDPFLMLVNEDIAKDFPSEPLNKSIHYVYNIIIETCFMHAQIFFSIRLETKIILNKDFQYTELTLILKSSKTGRISLMFSVDTSMAVSTAGGGCALLVGAKSTIPAWSILLHGSSSSGNLVWFLLQGGVDDRSKVYGQSNSLSTGSLCLLRRPCEGEAINCSS